MFHSIRNIATKNILVNVIMRTILHYDNNDFDLKKNEFYNV